ncbi:hypothetical protein HMPREF0080_01606 [Anaeroglobus geminatus F0357]|uniref:Uncharacterized protein n=1 Tax=Anaeroglobus geminatus F0357 TaxID=861450 RepID=G9YIW2_9FIRM|nr:hypothetical protein HMPREF0080_01606 [Anaeroglobus geminatus F0357]
MRRVGSCGSVLATKNPQRKIVFADFIDSTINVGVGSERC